MVFYGILWYTDTVMRSWHVSHGILLIIVNYHKILEKAQQMYYRINYMAKFSLNINSTSTSGETEISLMPYNRQIHKPIWLDF